MLKLLIKEVFCHRFKIDHKIHLKRNEYKLCQYNIRIRCTNLFKIFPMTQVITPFWSSFLLVHLLTAWKKIPSVPIIHKLSSYKDKNLKVPHRTIKECFHNTQCTDACSSIATHTSGIWFTSLSEWPVHALSEIHNLNATKYCHPSKTWTVSLGERQEKYKGLLSQIKGIRSSSVK